MAGGGTHEVGFIFLDADLVDTWDSAPEADEISGFRSIAFHAHHLRDDLDRGAAFMLESGEANKVVADLLKARAFAVELVTLLRSPVETHGDVFDGSVEEAAGVGFIEQGAVGGEEVEMPCVSQ